MVAVLIESVAIENLLSFKACRFNFNRYNVIVGPNNSGKTNLVRILQVLVKGGLVGFELPPNIRHKDGVRSQIRLAVEMSDDETRMVIQTLVDKDVTQETDLNLWRRFTMVLNWQEWGTNQPTWPTLIYFRNNTVVSIELGEYQISYYEPADMPDFEQRLDKLCNMDYDQIHRYIHGGVEVPIHKERVRELITGNTPKTVFSNECGVIIGKPVNLNTNPQKQCRLEIVRYMNIDKPGRHIWLPNLMSKIMLDSFVQAGEMHPTVERLTDMLFELKSQNEPAYVHLQELFVNLFPDTTIRVEQKNSDGKAKVILITDHQRTFELTDSASGYHEAAHILYTVLDRPQSTVFLDEPEVHFHPAKIKQLSQKLMSLTRDSSNQITVITHSPEFVDPRLLTPNSTSMLTMVTKIGGESAVASPKNHGIRLKPHMLEPDVFFANAVFLVEGSSDEFAIRAISDMLDGILEVNDITIVNCGGVKGIGQYVNLLKAYSIRYHGMADQEYRDDDLTVFDVDLEDELRKTVTMSTTDYPKGSKFTDADTYRYVTQLLETKAGFERLKATKIWASVKKALNVVDADLSVIDRKYE